MTGIRFKVTNSSRIERQLRNIPAARQAAVQRAVTIGAERVRGQAALLIQQGPPRSGRAYQIAGKTHIASAPGEPPKTRSGRLAGSIFVRPEDGGMAASVGTNIEYGRYLEFGTKKMAARPWLFPTFERLKNEISRRIMAAFIR